MASHDKNCVMHCHTSAGVGVSSQKQGLLPITQMALTVLGEVRYNGYEGARLRGGAHAHRGDSATARCHPAQSRTLTVGATVAEASRA